MRESGTKKGLKELQQRLTAIAAIAAVFERRTTLKQLQLLVTGAENLDQVLILMQISPKHAKKASYFALSALKKLSAFILEDYKMEFKSQKKLFDRAKESYANDL